jgi:Acyl-CoA reductase (LuxC)
VEQKIKHLQLLKLRIEALAIDEDFLYRVESTNNWFTPISTASSLNAISSEFLAEDKLRAWLSHYKIEKLSGTTGLILAGNIPLVGFHDILCAYFCSENVLIKLSSKDALLTKKILDIWAEIDTDWAQRFSIVERIVVCDRIIATGSNNSFQYFEYYFKKFKHILRQNRTSVAVLKIENTDAEIDALMDDIFMYYGLGCRNVSKLFIEKGFELKRIFEASERYNFLFGHTRYMNNYDYQRTLLLLNNIEHLSNNFLMLREHQELFTAISVLHYEYFESESDLNEKLKVHDGNLQCIVGSDYIPFGQSQCPGLSDYADGVDTMQFLID